MSQIRIAKAVDIGAFPGSQFVVDGSPPIAQCQEAQIAYTDGITTVALFTVTKVGAWAGIDLAGKKITITSPAPESGTYGILSNTDDIVTTDHSFSFSTTESEGTIHDTGQAYLTRNESSFQRFIEAQGNAHTTKGGQLYTDLTDPPMDDACTDTFNPE